jgi:hypothetical protein
MAHLQPSWPDQVLCKENKRKALAEQQRRWMAQREQSLNQRPDEDDSDSDSLEDLNGFIASVGRKIGDDKPRHSLAAGGSYEDTNAMLRELHFGRRGAAALKADSVVQAPLQDQAADSNLRAPAAASLASRRSAAQRAAAERLVQPRQQPQAERHAPAPLIGSEDFYKHQQKGIRHYRTAYDARVNAHFDALAAGKEGLARAAPPPPVDAIGALAHENASRHVAPIRQLVRGSSSGGEAGALCRGPHHDLSSRMPSAAMPPASMLGFTSDKTTGRRGGRAGRSGSIRAALQAAKDRGPIL